MTGTEPLALDPPDNGGRSEDVGPEAKGSLRSVVVKGGLYLAARHGAAVLIGLIGAIALTRRIGPSAFGLYVTLSAVYLYMQVIGSLGLDVYLVRTSDLLTKRSMDVAFTLMLALAVTCTLVGIIVLLPLLERLIGTAGLSGLGRPMLLLLPISVVSQVPLAKLEHELRYPVVALIEGTAQLVLYAVALPLAYRGWGAAAGVAAWMAQQGFQACALFISARYRPALALDMARATEMIRYGFGFSASIWVWKLRELVNPVVVGHYAGPAAVGFIALAIRLVENLAFVKRATWRMSIAVLGHLQGEPSGLRRAIQEGMILQLLALGPLLVLFACVGHWVLPLTYGPRWTPVLAIFPFVGVAYLANSMFNLHSSGLYVVRLNWQVAKFHIVHVAVFAASAAILVPRVGLLGYGYAELTSIASYALVHMSAVRAFGSPDYVLPAVWFLAFAGGLFVDPLGLWALAGVFGITLWPKTWGQIRCSFASVVVH